MTDSARRVAVLGGSRIPCARQNGPYAKASNQDMLTATLDNLTAKFGLDDAVLGEVSAGAVLKHSRDFNLTRESVLGSRLAPETPAYDVQQACGTGPEATILVANKIALGQIECGVAGGVDTRPTRRWRSTRDCARRCWTSTVPARPPIASSCSPACDSGWMDDLVVPFLGLERDQNLRPDSLRAWEDPVFGADKLGRAEPLGAIDRDKLNVHGGSLGAGDPFGAMCGRIVAALAKELSEAPSATGLISVCAAGGLGVTAILEGTDA
jgi:acetyl-CoA acetyltransferase